MRNKGLVITLTLLVSALCIYFLSLTLVSRGVQKDAVRYASRSGKLNEKQRQHYLDSVWRAPVFGPLTYKEVRQSELGLGLDLNGGMHVTLEVSPVEIVRAMSGNSKDAAFNKALEQAQELRKTNPSTPFTTLFAQSFRDVAPNDKLARIFANTTNKSRGIDINSTNEKVIGEINKEVDEAINRSFNILRSRIDKFGTSQPSIQRVKGTGRIQIELPGVDNPDRVRKLVQGQAKLEFWEVWRQDEFAPYLNQLNQVLSAKETAAATTAAATPATASNDTTATAAAAGDSTSLASQLAKKNTATAKADSAAPQKNVLGSLFTMPGTLGANIRDTARVNAMLRSPDTRAVLPSNLTFMWGVKPDVIDGQEYLQLYAIRKSRDVQAPIGGEVISDARGDFDQMSGRAEVSMQMNPGGARKWQRLTAANIGRQVAIVLDDNVYSAPVVQAEIAGGNSSISGNFTIEEAQDLANILKAGKLPAPTRIVEEAIVGPSLGKEATNQGLYSTLAGLAIIMVFMAAYYGRAGLVADAALLFNLFLIMGVLAQLSFALTLPGIAGLLLVIAASVDANVLIFERIREELDHGLSPTDAINKGYSRAISAIFDSNVTQLIIAVILGFFGTGPVQNFAITLGIGVFTSFLSAVYVSRLIIERMVKNGNTKLSFSTALSHNLFKGINLDIVGKRKIAYAASTVFIVIGFVLMYLQGGPNLGVDFRGGREYIVSFNQPIVASDVRDLLTNDYFGGAGTEVKTFGAESRLRITTGYLAADESADADNQVEAAMFKGLNAKYSALNPTKVSSSKVGATIADDIKRTSVLSLGLTLLAIFVYVLFRFEKWQYSMAAVVALFHDALLVIACFPIARAFGLNYEMDQVFVAAILTTIGFSMNDTIVIYDRIREYLRENKHLTFAQVVNPALNSTFSRTMITFTTVFLVMVVLYVFGGETLRSFSFAMILGIIFGTYSSLYIAAPLILDTYGRKEKDRLNTTTDADAPKLSTAQI
ncbi:protein translocase subunit SecDF [Hymenobacter sediminis]|uniref:protein translocase subunit SecDF n=1 Tax=Hymenobacter sediminis TaxID=2218621 RepID=UPI000DA6ADF7|nr:protein translocase subunit SecDF [Hymenobacter sediminis]RPD50103.1 protein translocase subunit SecDF [Hymenobacter sediminis]